MNVVVSVLIPAWNGAELLPDALVSLQSQTETRWEAIVVDDGSQDATADVAAGFSRRDSRIRVVRQANAGTQAARNTALHAACGEWIALLDQDDVWLPRKIEAQLALLRARPDANLLFTNYTDWNGANDRALRYRRPAKMPAGDVAARLPFSCLFQASTVMIPRRLALELGGFDPRFHFCGDWDMWLRVAEQGIDARGVWEPLVRYRVWPGNESRKIVPMAAEVVQMLAAACLRPQSPAIHRACGRAVRVARANLELAQAARHAEVSHAEIARSLWRSWTLYPRRVKTLLRCAGVAWPSSLGGAVLRRRVLRRIRTKWLPA